MIVTKVKANNLCKPGGIGKDDTSSRRVGNEVADQLINGGQGGMSQIETQQGDTLESVAKGHLQGSGQKVDLGNLLFEQSKILSENWDQIKDNMRDGTEDPKDFKTFRGRQLPQGIKINLSTTHTQHSITPANPVERDQISPSRTPKDEGGKAEETNDNGSTTADTPTDEAGQNNYSCYAGAGSISNTDYALEMHNVELSGDVINGMANYLRKNKQS